MSNIELFTRRDELAQQIRLLKVEVKEIDEKLSDSYLPIARQKLSELGKDFGTTSVLVDNMKFKVKVGKKVAWDQEALKQLFISMSPENANHYAKITYHVEETKYTAAPPDVRDQLQSCRTTEIGSFKVELEKI